MSSQDLDKLYQDPELSAAWRAEFDRLALKKSTLMGFISVLIFPATLVDIGLVEEGKESILIVFRVIPSIIILLAWLAQRFLGLSILAMFYLIFISIASASTYRVSDVDTSNFLMLNVTIYVMFGAIPSIRTRHAIFLATYATLLNLTVFFLFYADTIPLGQSGLVITIAAIILFVLVNKFRYDITKRNFFNSMLLKRQKEEIENQHNDLLKMHEEINQQKEEILAQRDAIEEKNHALTATMNELEKKNQNITSSINYASRIQSAILSLEDTLSEILPDKFIFLKPKDIVSGDFYWFAKKDDYILMAAVDCTGHGVPGAFMSMIGESLLNNIVFNKQITCPDEVLQELHKGIRTSLNQKATQNRDGMDVGLCRIDLKDKKLLFAGAKRPLVYIKEGKMFQIKGENQSVGGVYRDKFRTYTRHEISFDIPTNFYLFSDGYQDQFGDPNRKKFLSGNLRALLMEMHTLPMKQQHEKLEETILQWMEKGNEPQIDDILVMGARLA